MKKTNTNKEKRSYKNWEKEGIQYLQTLRQLILHKENSKKNKHWDKQGKQYLETSRNNKEKKEKVHGNTAPNMEKCP